MATKKPNLTVVDEDASRVYDPVPNSVQLGDRVYGVREVPIGRIKRFRTQWLDFFSNLNGIMSSANVTENDTATALFGMLEDKPYELMSIVIPTLDRDSFEDEDEGATIPQIMTAFEKALEVNKLEFLKRAVPFVVEMVRLGMLRQRLDMARMMMDQAQPMETTETENSST